MKKNCGHHSDIKTVDNVVELCYMFIQLLEYPWKLLASVLTTELYALQVVVQL